MKILCKSADLRKAIKTTTHKGGEVVLKPKKTGLGVLATNTDTWDIEVRLPAQITGGIFGDVSLARVGLKDVIKGIVGEIEIKCWDEPSCIRTQVKGKTRQGAMIQNSLTGIRPNDNTQIKENLRGSLKMDMSVDDFLTTHRLLETSAGGLPAILDTVNVSDEGNNGILTFVSTDKWRMSIVRPPCSQIDTGFGGLFSSGSMEMFARAAKTGDYGDVVRLSAPPPSGGPISKNIARIQTTGRNFHASAMSRVRGEYPRWQKILVSAPTPMFTVDDIPKMLKSLHECMAASIKARPTRPHEHSVIVRGEQPTGVTLTCSDIRQSDQRALTLGIRADQEFFVKMNVYFLVDLYTALVDLGVSTVAVVSDMKGSTQGYNENYVISPLVHKFIIGDTAAEYYIMPKRPE